MGILSQWQQKLIAVFLLAAVVWSALSLFIFPSMNEIRQHSDLMSNAQHQLDQYHRIANGTEALSTRLSEVSQSDFDRYFYRKSSTATVAAASIQNDLRRWINGSGGQVVSAQGKAASSRATSVLVPVTVTFTGDTKVLQNVLHEIEKNQPYLIVDRMTVKQTNATRRGGNAGNQNPSLTVVIDVTGYVKTGGAS